MADLSETVEMATLDKEMAEEKAETLQLELWVDFHHRITMNFVIFWADKSGEKSWNIFKI